MLVKTSGFLRLILGYDWVWLRNFGALGTERWLLAKAKKSKTKAKNQKGAGIQKERLQKQRTLKAGVARC